MAASSINSFGHLLNYGVFFLSSLELAAYHLVGGGDGEIEMPDCWHSAEGGLNIGGNGSYPSFQADGL